ncbi:hypothetical protein N7539_006120 [Penicillium diatomitis]|uniref:HMG box domain-containing protein n=1 Tax=Penicillium diatomitis TaxID=2819901 RepID=A0A9W9X3P3_9EURO|nr:uncharacterized protein N7539_006120 [Penicillium diatomitis]KAJ5482674.1 hypothetical protein N7539_006120 [Penicillium diatomitis]
MVEPPIRDMEAWVNRSQDERKLEVNAKNGEIPRPMNSFMLYRSAYIARIKSMLGRNCNQNVSRVAGLSWKAESKEVRAHFEKLAIIERQNHAISHPGYKFKPNKAAVTPPRRPDGLSPPQLSNTPAASIRAVSVDWDEKYKRESTPGLMHSRTEGYDFGPIPSSRETTPFGTPDSMLTTTYLGYMSHPWSNTSYPCNGLPMAETHVEDVYFPQASQATEDTSFSNNGLTGLPGATHELLQPQPTHVVPSHIVNGHLDPQLLSCPGEGSGLPFVYSPPTPPANPYRVFAEEGCFLPATYSAAPSPVPLSKSLPTSAPMQREPSWDVKYQDHDGMDSWINNSNSEY